VVEKTALTERNLAMKKLFVAFTLFCLGVFSAFGEENTLYYEVQQAKKSNISFENAVLEKAAASASALKDFVNPNEVFFFKNISIDVKRNKSKAVNLVMPLGTKSMVLELVDVSELLQNYEVKTSDGKTFPANKEIKHYRGIVKDVGNSLVALTFYENKIIGLISTDEGNFNVVTDKKSGKHLFYNEKNLRKRPVMKCGTLDDQSISYDPNVLLRQRDVLSGNVPISPTRVIDKTVRFYVETEYDVYQAHGNVSSVEGFVAGLFNQVAILYLNEDILTSVSCMYIWVSNDPYTAATTHDLLGEFQGERTSIIGDLGILLTSRQPGDGGRAAGYNGLCNVSTAGKLAVAMVNNYYEMVPVYSWSVNVITHEFGHLLGSYHTHACVWNGNGTAIDGCFTVEGSCQNPGLPPNGGTIMSYCYLQDTIKFNLGFGPQPGNVIRDNVINANCLLACDTPLNFNDQTVTQAAIVNFCGTINVQNTTVTPIGALNSGTLDLRAGNGVNIRQPFTVHAGGSLTIQKP